MRGNAPLTQNATLLRWFLREKNENFIPRQDAARCATFVGERLSFCNINLPLPLHKNG
jgi:hypothetical protein